MTIIVPPVTIRNVAQAAGVSKTTAVCVLNNTPGFRAPEATRQKVQAAALRLGYRRNAVASALSSGRIHTIGVVVPFYETSSNRSSFGMVYAKDVLIAVTEAAQEVRLRVTLIPYDDALPIEELTDGRVDGLILVAPRSAEFTNQVSATGFPCVSIGTNDGLYPITIDEKDGVMKGVAHLVGLGHHRIASRISDWPDAVHLPRQEGFLLASEQNGLLPEEQSIFYSNEALFAALQNSRNQRPTAVVAFNDWQAFEIVEEAHRIGLRVPNDLSVIGFDNNILAEACRPALTTIVNPLRELAEEAIVLLQALWRGETSPRLPPPIPTALIVRASTAPPA